MSRPRHSSGSWRRRQDRDPYVQKARRDGWRSRAVYKLEQILEKERLLHAGMTCIDLGAAPGGWSQFVSEWLKGKGTVIAVDLLPMNALGGVEFIQGDFTDEAVLERLRQLLRGKRADLVMSDMAPNITGNKAVDQPKSLCLGEFALEFAREVLTPGGSFVCKLFQGAGTEELVAGARRSFERVRIVKPPASRAGSSEVYLVARNYGL